MDHHSPPLDSSALKRTKIESILDAPAPNEPAHMSPDRPDSPLASMASAASSVLEEETPRVPTPKSPVEAIGAVLLAEFSGKVEQATQLASSSFPSSSVPSGPLGIQSSTTTTQSHPTSTTTQPQYHSIQQPQYLPRPISPSQLVTNTHVTNATIPPLQFARPLPNSLVQLQAQLAAAHFHAQAASTNKARLSGPIRAAVNIRHGVWAPRLRCRKRKNLHAKSTILIHAHWTVEQLVAAVRSVLPDDFVWNPQDSPLRYQAVNDQSLQSLKAITPEALPSAQSLYAAFDVVRNRRSDGDNFVLQLYVYGTWMALLKHPQSATPQLKHFLSSSEPVGSVSASVSSLKPVQLECVSLEMKVNGAFVRAEFSKRSFLAALRACQAADDDAEEVEEEEEADDDEDEDDDHEHEHEQDLN